MYIDVGDYEFVEVPVGNVKSVLRKLQSKGVNVQGKAIVDILGVSNCYPVRYSS